MSADLLPPLPHEAPAGGHQALLRWLAGGAAGAALFFGISAHLPETFRPAGLLAIVLGAAAGWGLGRWGSALRIRPSSLVALAAGLIIAAGHVLAALETHRDGVRKMRASKAWQEPVDPISAKFKEFLEHEPEGETPEARRERLATLAAVERGEAMHRQRLEYLTFQGYLASRIPREWGKWSAPWPAIFWGAEIALSSTLGGWLALWTLRAAFPGGASDASRSNLDHEIQGSRG
ncbi:MAG: hypothetical protein ACM3U2_10720 [Deltaproteobacteria bacterium]